MSRYYLGDNLPTGALSEYGYAEQDLSCPPRNAKG